MNTSTFSNARNILLDWFRQGAIAENDFAEALRVAGVFPSDVRWRRLMDLVLLAFGLAFLLSGITTFFAANWQELGRFGRFVLVDGLLIIALLAAWRLGLATLAGRSALFAASTLVGVLLALVGQTYQTGADTYELFAAWAALIFPWTLIARFSPLWVLWILLVNLGIFLYHATFPGLFGVSGTGRESHWLLAAVNAVLLIAFEVVGQNRLGLSSGRWIPRVLALGSGLPLTLLAVGAVIDDHARSAVDIGLWVLAVPALFWVYRRVLLDVFMLAGALLSLLVVIVSVLVRHLLGHGNDIVILLFIAIVVIGFSAVSGWWLTRLVARSE